MKLITLLVLIINQWCFSQTFKGAVRIETKNTPAQYINIGIPSKHIGTVSDEKGNFEINLAEASDKDSIIFSSIGFISASINVVDFKNRVSRFFLMQESVTNLKEISISSKGYEDRLFGVTTNSRNLRFISHKQAGHEYCLLVSIQKTAFIQKVFFDIAFCSYDSVLFKLNIYRQTTEDGFENILQKPILVKVLKRQIDKPIVIDLTEQHIFVDDNFLIALENVNQLDIGELSFCAKMFRETLSRESVDSPFKTEPVGISLSVEAKVGK